MSYMMRLSPRFQIPVFAILGVILLDIWAVHSGRLINFDGILYLRSADAFLNNDYSTAYAIYSWPLYSILIALGSHLTSASLITSAYALNGGLQVILILAFVQLVKQLGGNRRCQWFALAIMLVHPYLNEYRSYIIRDFGYWAFLLVGMTLLITAVTKQRAGYAVLGTLTLLISTTFRIEGLIFLVLLPFSFLWVQQFEFKTRLKFVLLALVPLVLATVVVFGLAYIYTDANLRHVGRMDHVINLSYAIPTIRENISSMVMEMKTSVLDYQAQHGASVIVIGGLLVLMVFEIIKVTNPLLFLISAYSAKRHFMPKSFGKRLCKYTLYINLAILLYFVGTFNFLSGRYVMPISLILLLWAPFTVEYLYQYFCVSRSNQINYWYYPAVLFIFSGLLMYHLGHWHYDKMYIREAGQWTQKHIKNKQQLMSNSAEYLFYSCGVIKDWNSHFLNDSENLLKQNRDATIALKLNKKQVSRVLPTLQNWQFLATFQNKKGDRVIIMQKSPV